MGTNNNQLKYHKMKKTSKTNVPSPEQQRDVTIRVRLEEKQESTEPSASVSLRVDNAFLPMLKTLNPVLASYRKSPDGKIRPLFNDIHYDFADSSLILTDSHTLAVISPKYDELFAFNNCKETKAEKRGMPHVIPLLVKHAGDLCKGLTTSSRWEYTWEGIGNEERIGRFTYLTGEASDLSRFDETCPPFVNYYRVIPSGDLKEIYADWEAVDGVIRKHFPKLDYAKSLKNSIDDDFVRLEIRPGSSELNIIMPSGNPDAPEYTEVIKTTPCNHGLRVVFHAGALHTALSAILRFPSPDAPIAMRCNANSLHYGSSDHASVFFSASNKDFGTATILVLSTPHPC